MKEEDSASMEEQPNYVTVDSLKPRMRDLDVVVKVVSKGEPREVRSRRNGSTHSVAEALVGERRVV